MSNYWPDPELEAQFHTAEEGFLRVDQELQEQKAIYLAVKERRFQAKRHAQKRMRLIATEQAKRPRRQEPIYPVPHIFFVDSYRAVWKEPGAKVLLVDGKPVAIAVSLVIFEPYWCKIRVQPGYFMIRLTSPTKPQPTSFTDRLLASFDVAHLHVFRLKEGASLTPPNWQLVERYAHSVCSLSYTGNTQGVIQNHCHVPAREASRPLTLPSDIQEFVSAVFQHLPLIRDLQLLVCEWAFGPEVAHFLAKLLAMLKL